MIKRNILITCVLLTIILLISCGGGVKITEPKGRIVDNETGEVFKDSTELMEHIKAERPDEYSTLYELSKSSETLTKSYIQEKTKILNGKDETIYVSNETGAITEKKYFEILKNKYEIEVDPMSVIEAYYSSLSDRKFEAAFGLLHPNGISFPKYENPETFEKMNSSFAETMKITDYKAQTIRLNDMGNEPVVKIGCKLVGFFIKENKDNDSKELTQEELRKMDKNATVNPVIETIEWEYKETGIVWVTLATSNGNWLIYDIP